VVVLDYGDVRMACAAQRVLDAAGIPAVYILEKLVAVSDDPTATLLLVHRVTVAPADAQRAAAVLDEHGLTRPPASGAKGD
jgi:hypothetical protein